MLYLSFLTSYSVYNIEVCARYFIIIQHRITSVWQLLALIVVWAFFFMGTLMDYTKVCKACQEELPATSEYFNKHKGGKYGLMAKCKLCHKIYNQNMYKKHQEKRVKAKKEYWQVNHDKVLESNKKSYQKHRDKRLKEKQLELKLYPEKMKQRRKEQYIKHREKRLLEVKDYAKNNKNKIRKRQAEYTINRYRNDPAFKIKMNLSRRLRNCIKKDSKSIVDFIGCSIDDVKTHLEKQFTNGMNWDNYGKWHIDHIIPCASFDLTDPEQQKKCFHYSNLQPLWASDNIRKSDKVFDSEQ